MAEIKLISECFVKPKHEIEAAKTPYHLSPIEIMMLSIAPIQKGLLFTLDKPACANVYGRTKTISSFLEKLKQSLSISLVHFYPLAGRMVTQKYPDEQACTIFVDCNKGPGARLIHAVGLEVTVSDITSSTYVPPVVQSFFDLGEKLVNFDGHTRALLCVQVTELQDGVFLGFTMNHCVVDGTTFIHFVSTLSEIFRSIEDISESESTSTKISRTPIFNIRPWIKNSGNEGAEVLKLPHLEPEKLIDRGSEPVPLRERIFHFSAESLAALKAKANQECGTQIVISSFQALSALLWISITRARNLSSDQSTSCSILMNTRKRFVPPLSEDSFGNFIWGTMESKCSVEELLGHGLGWAAAKVHKSILALDELLVLEVYKYFSHNPRVIWSEEASKFFGPARVTIGGSARFDMYGPEFGFGRAVAVRMGYANKEDGKVTANPGCEGQGSVDLEVCLAPHSMTALEADLNFMTYVTLH